MSLAGRIKNIIITPKTEWAVIASEEPNADSIFLRYALPLIIVSAAAGFIGYAFIWSGGFDDTIINWGGSFRDKVINRAIYYGFQTVFIGAFGLWLTALIVNALAKYFESEKNMGRSVQLIAYVMTPVWIGGLLMLYPPLGFIGLLFGLYGLYLLYLGLPQLMKTPSEKIVTFRVISIVILLDVYIGLGFLFRLFLWDAMIDFLTHVLINAHPLK